MYNIEDPKNLNDGKYRQKFIELVDATNTLDDDNSNQIIKCLVVYKLGIHLEHIFANEKDKTKLFQKVSEEIDNQIKFITQSRNLNKIKDPNLKSTHFNIEDIEDQTQDLYGNLWIDFDNETYFNEAFERLKLRLDRNKVDIDWFKDKLALDAGCGGGRYTVALSKFGFKKVIGLDLSEKGLPDALKRIKGTEHENKVEFIKSNVLDLPFEDNHFDFVFSNGVLHHTKDPIKGIKECFRVLKPGGKLWLYLWWEDGIINMYWDTARAMLKGINPITMKNILITLGLPPNRRFYFMDPWFVPIRKKYNSKKVIELLQEIGFNNISLLTRGVDNDANELSLQLGDIGKIVYGEGDLRFMAEKPNEGN